MLRCIGMCWRRAGNAGCIGHISVGVDAWEIVVAGYVSLASAIPNGSIRSRLSLSNFLWFQIPQDRHHKTAIFLNKPISYCNTLTRDMPSLSLDGIIDRPE